MTSAAIASQGVAAQLAGRPTWPLIGLGLAYRTVGFAAFQAVFALVAAGLGASAPWETAAAWWPLTAACTGAAGLALLVRLFRREGTDFFDLYRLDRRTWRSDLLAFLGLMLVSGPISFLPNSLIGNWLFGDVAVAFGMFFKPLPFWAMALSLVAFPLGIALTELPTYFGYVMPRVEALTGRRWLAVLLPVIWLSTQHMTLPLLFDWRFLLWRGLMFLPFALMLGLAIRWRPRLLPYFMIGHGLMDGLTAAMLFTV